MKTITTLLFLILSFNSFGFVPGTCSHIKQIAQPGDVLFISLPGHPFYSQIEKAMDFWSGHVGIVLKNELGDLYVSESTYPFSKDTNFCDFVNKAKTKIAVRRLKNKSLSVNDLEDIKAATKTRLGYYYDLGFNLDSSKQFCSKFVYEVFDEALGIEIGKIETFQELLDSHIDTRRRDEARAFFEVWFFRWAIPGIPNIPWERRTVTPKSQYYDHDLTTVYTWESN